MAAATSATARADTGDRARQALWAALVLILVWGANFSVQKAIFQALSPGGFLFVRYLIMPVAATLLLCFRFGTRWPRLSRLVRVCSCWWRRPCATGARCPSWDGRRPWPRGSR